ncbi:hypothetical protein M0K88_004849 [Escherichia coli]|nr:hypothetical protein [Escherichia coli]
MNMISRMSASLRAWWDGYVSNTDRLPWNIRIAAFMFSGKRSDYYLYLADLIDGTGGKKMLRQIFLDDAKRYPNTSRGKLSAHWAYSFDKHGGKLAKTFAGTLPDDEVMLLDLLQKKGGEGIFEDGLRQLSENTALVSQAVGMVLKAIRAFLFPVAIMLTVMIGVPSFSVPQIKSMFANLKPEQYPEKAKQLFAIADFISHNGVILGVSMILLIGAMIYSLPVLSGRLRLFFDKYLIIWAIHRDFEAIKFISGLTLILKSRKSESARLVEALEMMLAGANPWKARILQDMLDAIHSGKTLTEVFKSGMFDKEMQHSLEDMIIARQLNGALEYLRPRLKDRVFKKLASRCNVAIAVAITFSVVLTTYVLVLHTLSITSLQQAMQQTLY